MINIFLFDIVCVTNAIYFQILTAHKHKVANGPTSISSSPAEFEKWPEAKPRSETARKLD